MVSQSGASLVHFFAPCNRRTAQSFDRLRMKGKRLRIVVGGRSFDRLRMKGKRLRMVVGGRSFDRLRMKGKRLRMMVGGSVLGQAQDEE